MTPPPLPSGTVTFLFTDIAGSTKLSQHYPDQMPALLTRHHEILHRAVQAYNGYAFQIVGEQFIKAVKRPPRPQQNGGAQ